MEVYFKNYQIIILDNDGKLSDPIYTGRPNLYQFYICYTGSHYNVIKYIKKALNFIYLCPMCQIKTRNIPDHFCKYNCKMCNRPGCVKEIDKYTYFKCEFCLITCNSESCKDSHQNHVCVKLNKCDKCTNLKRKIHVCIGEKYCKNCKKSS